MYVPGLQRGKRGFQRAIDLIQDGGKIKRKKEIYHIPNICHLRDPPHFFLVTTFKYCIDWRNI